MHQTGASSAPPGKAGCFRGVVETNSKDKTGRSTEIERETVTWTLFQLSHRFALSAGKSTS